MPVLTSGSWSFSPFCRTALCRYCASRARAISRQENTKRRMRRKESLPRRKSGVTASIPVSKRAQSGVAQDARRSEQPMGDRRARASFSFEAVRYNGGRLRFRHKRGCCGSFRFNCFNYFKYFEQFEYFKYDRRRRYRGRRSCRHFHGAVASEKCSFHGNRACGEGPSHRTAQLSQGESRPLCGL